MKVTLRRTAQAGLAALFAGGGVLLAASPAGAHVTVTPSVATAGAYTVLTVSVPHGCEGSGTTKVSIRMPDEIISVTPTINVNWTPSKVMAALNPPVKDSHGNEITERVTEVVYTAKTPLPDGMRDTFELSLKLPDAPGKQLVFPAVQTCQKGETAWVQVPAEGQKADELEHPAPAFVLKAAEPAAAEAQTSGVALASVEKAVDSEAGTSTVSWIALALGGLGFLLGGYAAVQATRNRSRNTTA